MADPVAATHLYKSLTQLTYLEARLASQPLVPFAPDDANHLGAQSDAGGSCAARFRQRDPVTMTSVANAQSAVDRALAMVTAILQYVPVNLTAQEVFGAIDSAFAAVDAV